ncbi:MAG TPA: glycoside hydrolase/phage tail family protein [Rhizomicrobium sp.]|nr:glycoside hydrolase/phage tail family protein [Rhizomicrobium sp.]
MAALVLGVAGEAIGASICGTILGVSAATIGGAVGALIGQQIDNALMPGTHISRTGPRLSDINVQSSSEGAPVPRVFGRMRVAGQLIWATRFLETAVVATQSAGGGKGGPKTTVSETDYTYSISFAVGLCAGVATKIGRVWADGSLIDLSQFTTRFYAGDETQSEDPLIQEIEGADNTPSYRGLCYIAFEDMPLAQFGNRIPQLQFEIIRAISPDNPDALENRLAGVALIPGAGEFIYATEMVSADDGNGTTTPKNAHNASGVADIAASLDELQILAPNMGAVSLVVGWFGDDLRAEHILIKPGVEYIDGGTGHIEKTYPQTWSVNGVARVDARLVSQIDGRPAYGGTPSDESVVQAIADLRGRGLAVLFNPFVFMDIASGNTLIDPYTGASGQPAYPWRGRITCDPAPGVSGSPDKTSAAATQVNAFFGSAAVGDFAVSGTSVSWSGGSDWGYRRMVLHYAHLCAAAGGVDAFLIGSELVGLTHVRDSATSYPAVAVLKTLAADVRSILGGGTKIGYAADWSEYNNHQTGAGEVLFNLDPLWSDSNIDFIGIDNYMPLADWRDGTAHLDYDALNGPTSIHDVDYLTANIQGGEDYDWYYIDHAARDAQTRTTISDGAYSKPWVFRAKDLWNWWSNNHYDRPGGTESGSHTGFVPQGKPIWFTELGCSAVEKGANEPNVFFDPKSAESALPYYSNGERDDLIQRRFLETHLKFWSDSANNPASGVYTGRMVDATRIFAWCWDARPFPFFPARTDVWGDAENYRLGHWLNGRLGAVQLADLVGKLCEDASFTDYDVSNLSGLVTGFAVTDTMSPRDAIAPLGVAFHFDSVESEGEIKFLMRGRPTTTALGENDLVMPGGEPGFGFSFNRAQETDLPMASRIDYIDADADYRAAVAEARRLIGASSRVAQSNLPLVLDQGQALGIGVRLLQDAWTMRETAKFVLAPSQMALDPADEVSLDAGGRTRCLRLTEINDAGARNIQAVTTDPSIYEPLVGPSRLPGVAQSLSQTGRSLVVFMDLPLLSADQVAWEPYAAAFASPWPGAVLIYKSASDSNFTLDTSLTKPAFIGETIADVYSGPLWRWDEINSLSVKLYNGTLSSLDDLSVLGGANVLAIENADGDWEVLQFATATLTAPNEWTLTRLLRGQAGTEGAMRAPVASGARVVVLNGAPAQLHLAQSEYALPFNYLYGPQSKAISDAAYQSAALQFAGVGYRPFSPCHVAGVPQSSGDIVLSWMRRDRSPGSDSWDQTEIPLSETAEDYEVDILSGLMVKRTLSSPTTSVTYTAAMQTADFGAPLSPGGTLSIAVYQISSIVGRGSAARVTIQL